MCLILSLPTSNEREAISSVGCFLEGIGFESICLWKPLGLGVLGGAFFVCEVWHGQFLRKTGFGVAFRPVRLLHRQRMDLEDTSQRQGAWPAEGTGHLGVETGRDVLWEQTWPVRFDGPHFLWSHRAPGCSLQPVEILLKALFTETLERQ